jgi:acetyltransferase-like isoleucine patch superfamily enzyme
MAARLARVLKEDFGSIQWRLLLANCLLFFCPRGSLLRFRTSVYRACGLRIGRGTVFLGNIEMSGQGRIWQRLLIGEDCVINTPLHADLGASITIGNGVTLGHHVVLITTDHGIGPETRRCGPRACSPITIEDGCWVGACTTVLPGVTIGRGSVVAAGSVVHPKHCPPANHLAAGVPAMPIKKLS